MEIEKAVSKPTKERLYYIDQLKGLAIILVVWGHCGIRNHYFSSIYFWHLPLFIMVSGILLFHGKKWEHPGKYSVRLLQTVMYPYVASGIFYLICNLIDRFSRGQYVSFEGGALLFLALDNGTAWFLPALFAGEIVAMLVICFSNKIMKKNWFIWIFMGVFLILGELTRTALWDKYGQYSNVSFIGCYQMGASMGLTAKMLSTLYAGRTLYFSFFILLGYAVFPLVKKIAAQHKKLVLIGSAVVVLVIVNLVVSFRLPDLHYIAWNETYNYLPFSIVLCVATILFFMTMGVRLPFLEYFGKHSLEIMIVHHKLKEMITAPILQGFIAIGKMNINPEGTVYSIVNAILVLFLSTIITEGINAVIPFAFRFDRLKELLVGKNKKTDNYK